MSEVGVYPSNEVNAFATGPAGNTLIAFSSGLVNIMSIEEIRGVVGHELSHLIHYDLKRILLVQAAGRHPGLVISNDEQNKFSPLITILPLTSQVDKIYPFQVFSEIKVQKFDGKLGEIDMEMMEQIERALHLTLALKTLSPE
ncbi:13562_t:CDS:2 [Ambispora gerdemannii]|uniref:13562_t:CDS:1 n=1 Tax=Ambispora gerdemannii TaxID=144530 RepID=A0A9N9FK60_9GLOM|nr:13562_t:CDS:2 [Ambispora gerdemannii]